MPTYVQCVNTKCNNAQVCLKYAFAHVLHCHSNHEEDRKGNREETQVEVRLYSNNTTDTSHDSKTRDCFLYDAQRDLQAVVAFQLEVAPVLKRIWFKKQTIKIFVDQSIPETLILQQGQGVIPNNYCAALKKMATMIDAAVAASTADNEAKVKNLLNVKRPQAHFDATLPNRLDEELLRCWWDLHVSSSNAMFKQEEKTDTLDLLRHLIQRLSSMVPLSFVVGTAFGVPRTAALYCVSEYSYDDEPASTIANPVTHYVGSSQNFERRWLEHIYGGDPGNPVTELLKSKKHLVCSLFPIQQLYTPLIRFYNLYDKFQQQLILELALMLALRPSCNIADSTIHGANTVIAKLRTRQVYVRQPIPLQLHAKDFMLPYVRGPIPHFDGKHDPISWYVPSPDCKELIHLLKNARRLGIPVRVIISSFPVELEKEIWVV
jgi:hypothetical protein